MPSTSFIAARALEKERHAVDKSSGYYIINPDLDLANTEKAFGPFLKRCVSVDLAYACTTPVFKEGPLHKT